MNSNKYTNTKIGTSMNLIGENRYRQFLALQASCGFAQRGGVTFPYHSESHSKRLISDVNILTSNENRYLIFSETIFSN
jgi:hypothetical protein